MRIYYVENSFQLLSSMDLIGRTRCNEAIICCYSVELYNFACTIAVNNIRIQSDWQIVQGFINDVKEVILFKDNGLRALKIFSFWRKRNVDFVLIEEGLSMYAVKGTYALSNGNLPKVIYRRFRRIVWYLKYGVWDSGEFGMCSLLSKIYLRDIDSFQRVKKVKCKLVNYQLSLTTVPNNMFDSHLEEGNYILLLLSPWVSQGYATEDDQIQFIEEVKYVCGNKYKLIVKLHPSENYENLPSNNIGYLGCDLIPIEALFRYNRDKIKVVISQGSTASVNLYQLYAVRSIVLFPKKFFNDNFLDYSEVLSMFRRNCEVVEGNFVESIEKII